MGCTWLGPYEVEMGTTSKSTRYLFLSETARRNFPKANGGSPLAAAAFVAQPSKPKKVVGIQIGAVSFVDEGVEPVLDLLQNKGHVDTRFLAAFAYGRGMTRRKIPGQSLPNHGKQKCDTDTFQGGRYAAAHSRYFSNTLLRRFRAPDLGAFGVFESVLPASRKRGVQNATWFDDAFCCDIPGVQRLEEKDCYDCDAVTPCFNNPSHHTFLLDLVEDYARSWQPDKIMYGSERQGAFAGAIGSACGGQREDPGRLWEIAEKERTHD